MPPCRDVGRVVFLGDLEGCLKGNSRSLEADYEDTLWL